MHATFANGRLHYAWPVAAITFLTLLAAAGIGATSAVLLLPLEKEFGWDRATVSFAVSVNLLLFGLTGPFAAALMETFGVRRVMVVALLTLSVAVGCSSLMRMSWQYDLLWGVLVGLGSGAMALVLGATVASRWFARRRGLVLGLLTASSATGRLVFLPVQAAVIEAAGWRSAVLLVSLVAFLVAVVVMAFMRNDPADLGLRPYGADGGTLPTPATRLSNPFAAAVRALAMGLRSRDFYLLAGSFFICGATTQGLVGTHLIPFSVEHGVPEVTAAGFLATIGVFDLIGTTGSGWLSDRVDCRKLLTWYYLLRGMSLLFLPYAFDTGSPGLTAFVVFYGLDWVATVPPTVRLAGEAFGRARVGVVFGWIFAAHQLGAAAAAFGAGAVHTWAGNYLLAFMSAGGLCLIAAVMVLGIGRPSVRARSAGLVPAGA